MTQKTSEKTAAESSHGPGSRRAPEPSVEPVHPLLELQRAAGNQAVLRLLRRGRPAERGVGGSYGRPERAVSAAPEWGAPLPAAAGEGPSWGAWGGEPGITVVQKGKSLTRSGSGEYKVRWGISGATKSGWVVQHVKFSASVKDGAGAKKTPKNPAGLEYWEGWQVTKGQVWVGFASGGSKHNADTFRTVDEGGGTKGTAQVWGRVRFLDAYDLKTPPWGYTVPAAGALPTMKTTPAGWSDAGAERHEMDVVWDATGKTPTQTVTTTP